MSGEAEFFFHDQPAGDQPPLSLSWLTLDYPSISTRAHSEYQQRMYANLDPE